MATRSRSLRPPLASPPRSSSEPGGAPGGTAALPGSAAGRRADTTTHSGRPRPRGRFGSSSAPARGCRRSAPPPTAPASPSADSPDTRSEPAPAADHRYRPRHHGEDKRAKDRSRPALFGDVFGGRKQVGLHRVKSPGCLPDDGLIVDGLVVLEVAVRPTPRTDTAPSPAPPCGSSRSGEKHRRTGKERTGAGR